MTHDPYSLTDRVRMTDRQRLEFFLEQKAKCCICGYKITPPKDAWIVEHVRPLWLDGTNDKSNLGVAHVGCAHRKTANESAERAKIRSTAEYHYGAKRSKRPMPCGKRSKFKKKMDGTVVAR